MKENKIAVIAAGGSGTRMGTDIPKQFINIGGCPVLIHTLRNFLDIDFDRILVLVPYNYKKYTCDLLCKYDISNVQVLAGGNSRNETILKAIDFLRENGELDRSTIILTHDSVRPFINKRIILDNLKACAEKGPCTTAIPATDTIVKGKCTVEEIFDRNQMLQIQTPQTFNALRFEEIWDSLSNAEKELATDCTRLFTLAGEKVFTIPGEISNIKLTYKSDIAFAEGYLAFMNETE